MHSLRFDGTFATWRQAARRALLQGLAPHQLQWLDEEAAPGLFDQPAERAPEPNGRLRVSPELLELLESAAQYRGDERWSLLYRVLWRFVQGERSAILAGDPDGSELQRRLKAVRREAHHLHAFVRFVPLPEALAERLQLDLVAYHEARARGGDTHGGKLSREGLAVRNNDTTYHCKPDCESAPCRPYRMLAKERSFGALSGHRPTRQKGRFLHVPDDPRHPSRWLRP